MINDEDYMRIAIEEAKKGIGLTAPNPPVGAVIVGRGVELARGWHRKAGTPHAERNAIQQVIELGKQKELKGATIYVTLEPCSTQGNTGACCDLLIEHQFQRVVYGSTDPNPSHVGKAKNVLGNVGIKVEPGVLQAECDHLIRAFAKVQQTGLPWMIAKTAMSLDGRITRPAGEGQWLSNEKSRATVHNLRCEVDAILTSGKTVRKDNPKLTLRGNHMPAEKEQPWRVVLTRQKKEDFDSELHLFSDVFKKRTIIFENKELDEVLKNLVDRGVQSVLIEAGGDLLGAFQDQNLIDEYVVYLAPMVTGGPSSAFGGQGVSQLEERLQLSKMKYTKIGNDVMLRAVI